MSAPNASSAWLQQLKRPLLAVFSLQRFQRRREFDGDRFEQVMVNNPRVAYRYVLMAIAVMLAPIDAHNFYAGHYIPAIAGLFLLSLFLFNIVLLTRDREPFLSAPTVLLLTLFLVLLSLAYGLNYNLYWIYPLLVALPVLLKARVSVWLGIVVGVVVTPFVFMRFDSSTAIIVCMSMVHTWLISAWLMFAVSEQSRRLSELAITDPLTGAFNRRHLQREARKAFKIWRSERRPATLLLLDVDYFKEVNDSLGHDAGDSALCSIVDIIRDRTRQKDAVFRYGGEEFVALLLETGEADAIQVAEDIRNAVHAADVAPTLKTTVSIGVCDVTQANSIEHWLSQCDRALYQAKAEGRNRVVIATPGAVQGRRV